MVKLDQIKEGSRVLVRGGFGNEPAKFAIVNSVEADIKNGLPGIDYTEEASGDGRWAYLDQVQKVVAY